MAEGEQEAEMVTKRKLTADRFLSDSQPSTQPQQARAKDRTPSPPPPFGRQKKKQHVEDQPLRVVSNAPTKTPYRPLGRIVIREPVSGPQPTARGDAKVASSSQATPNWQPTFTLDGEPLPSSASVRMWAQGEGGRVA